MTLETRRSVLTALAATVVAAPLLNGLAGPAPAAHAAGPGDPVNLPDPIEFPSNTALYRSSKYTEGVDWARRYHRAELPAAARFAAFDSFPRTAVLAPHGGSIELGTSELALAVAGWKPDAPAESSGLGPTYDYWMFEGLMGKGENDVLHVTASNCDDPAALAITGGSRHAVALHGCLASQLRKCDPSIAFSQALTTVGDRAVVVGGLDTTFTAYLAEGLRAKFGSGVNGAMVIANNPKFESLDGDVPTNITNRTYSGRGAQLEMTTELRKAMFGDPDGRADRAATFGKPSAANQDADRFGLGLRDVIRAAILRIERNPTG
ncbi:poly-gamma-glutamate hydrolase family protein [Kitasatospora sp. NPDC002040]|uniref:poly-gamma-glutamate hydrolase family protein n=1 Tax=Kitasatospora sp. NPDC002040 TaxID=3154661 RepID=UPI00331913B9